MFPKFNTLAAFAGGIAAGVTVGWLTAPRSGLETRQELAKKAESGREAVSDALTNGRDALTDAVNTGTERVRSLPPAVAAASGAASDAFRERLADGNGSLQ